MTFDTVTSWTGHHPTLGDILVEIAPSWRRDLMEERDPGWPSTLGEVKDADDRPGDGLFSRMVRTFIVRVVLDGATVARTTLTGSGRVRFGKPLDDGEGSLLFSSSPSTGLIDITISRGEPVMMLVKPHEQGSSQPKDPEGRPSTTSAVGKHSDAGWMALTPPPGSRGAKRLAMMEDHPALAFLFPLLTALGKVGWIVLMPLIAFLLDYLPDIPLPSIPTPDITLPEIPWPDITLPSIPWPDITLPSIPWPDITLPGWVQWLLSHEDVIVPFLVAMVIGFLAWRRFRSSARMKAQHTPDSTERTPDSTDPHKDTP